MLRLLPPNRTCSVFIRTARTIVSRQRFSFQIHRNMMETTNNSPENNHAGRSTVLDGSHGEGGGQILRNSMALSAIFERPLRIHSIRAKRSRPGLAAQHLTAIQLVAAIGGGSLEGMALKSMEASYTPPSGEKQKEESIKDDNKNDSNQSSSNNDKERVVTGTIDTAGSIVLLLQAALPCALLVPSHSSGNTKLILKGGTNASMAPQYDYWERVFLPMAQHCFEWPDNLIQATVLKRGYYPKGGGHVEVSVPSLVAQNKLPLPNFQLTERGTLKHIYIRSFHAGKLPRLFATQMAKAAKSYLQKHLLTLPSDEDSSSSIPIDMEIVTEENAMGSGLGILLVATTSTGCRLGGSTLCVPKQKAHQAGIVAAKELVRAIQGGGCVDEWLQDQLILFMTLAQGTSTLLTGCLTLHTQTAIDVAQQLVPGVVFEVKKLDDNDTTMTTTSSGNGKDTGNGYGQDGLIPGKHLITCHGIGYTGRTST